MGRHLDLLGLVECVDFLDWERLRAPGRYSIPASDGRQQKAPWATIAGGVN
jgi:hypothetical protein